MSDTRQIDWRRLPIDELGELVPFMPAETQREVAEVLERAKQDDIDARCAADPLYFLQSWTKTENPKYAAQGLPFRAPMPRKSYFIPLFEAFLQDPATRPRLHVSKSREMLTSLSVVGYGMWRAQWHQWFTIVQTQSEVKACALLEMARVFHENQPEWMKARHPLKSQSQTELVWADGGHFLAIPSGADRLRLYHGTLVILDEAAFLVDAEASFNTANPATQQLICISSAGPGWFAQQCMSQKISEGEGR